MTMYNISIKESIFKRILISFLWINLGYISTQLLCELNEADQNELNESIDESLTHPILNRLSETCFYGLIFPDLVVEVYS